MNTMTGTSTGPVPTTDRSKSAARPPAGGRRRRLPNESALLGSVGVAGFLAVCEIVPRLGLFPEKYLPPVSRILAELGQRLLLTSFWNAVADTIIAWALGLAIAFFAAVLLGFVIGSVPVLRAFTASTVEFLRPIPSVALIPLAILVYGVDIGSTLLLVVYAAFWQIYIQVLYGVADVDPVAEQTARSYGLGYWSRLRHVVWPSSLPYVFTGLRLGAAVALILTITAQLTIGSPGLGQQIQVAQSSGALTAVYALVIATGALGVLVNIAVRSLERRVLRWHTSVRGEVAS
ncbi:ABC-type nitrate/sulfonate/bicarbonate transport system permease component [Haloactinospora alba]|uniref:ABC-type nitrate/sulfonate/bicarbonate transport system permease component n=2 Tax=Haloactinospora alba TaxID=405555 RepID=A0A543NH03_9ACTN|nr:ABC-type nitrate/sulfonate/bicarbonate transport system permease component [Haloactinospora alba]